MPAYGHETAPPALRDYLARIVRETRDLLGGDLVAVILHGSLAMGAFHPPKSDIDLLVVTPDPGEPAARALHGLFARLHEQRPSTAGLEVSALRPEDLRAPVHPSPYLTHFSSGALVPQARKNGALPRDPDLVAHLMVARQRGVSLFGPPPADLIGPIRWEDYLAAVKYDIDDLLTAEGLLGSPRYAVLNLCRWAMIRSGEATLVPGKTEAARWALSSLPPAHHRLIAQALAAQQSEAPVGPEGPGRAGGPWDEAALLAFGDWVRRSSAE